MAMHFATCDITNLTVNADDTLTCSLWEFREVMFPMYELSPTDLGLWMTATAAFLAACFASRQLVKTINSAGSSD